MARKTKSFDYETYQKVSENDSILFAIASVLEEKEVCTFERLVEECFSFFPKSFGFSRKQEWPDARKIDRPLRNLRAQKLISGDPQNFFFLTKSGKKKAEEIGKKLRQEILKL